jgi:MFS transporter, PAT family, solute carrier family 33 (acetyl-CoA transportor), member 1
VPVLADLMVQRRSRHSRMVSADALDDEADRSSASGSADWWPDRWNILLLILLYTIQGFPMGFAFGSIPFLLKETVGFNDLAVFALAGWPYSIKLLMAPIVDSVYSSRFGRRKSWIIPVQAVSGSLMFSLSGTISQWVTDGNVYR